MLTRTDVEARRERELDALKALLLSRQVDSDQFEERRKVIEKSYRDAVRGGEAIPGRNVRRATAAMALLTVVCFASSIPLAADRRTAVGLVALIALLALDLLWHRLDRGRFENLIGSAGARLALEVPSFESAPQSRNLVTVTLLVKNFDSLVQVPGGVVLVRLLGELLDLAEKCARPHEGLVITGLRSELRVLFGLPDPERRLERAIDFARDFMRELRQRECRLGGSSHAVHVGMGIHQGPVIAGLIGNESRRSFEVYGKDVDLADELAKATGWEEILVSDPVYKDLEGRVTFTRREPMFSSAYNEITRIHALVEPGAGGQNADE